MQQTENKKSEGRFSSELFGWGESLMAVLVFFVVVFTFFVRLIGVDGMSMYPTLEDHSIMLVSNLNYTPERGDVVVLRKEGFYNNQPIVKRIIATGGDTVDIDPVTGDVSVNGEVETRRGHHLNPGDLVEVDAPWGRAAAIVGDAS